MNQNTKEKIEKIKYIQNIRGIENLSSLLGNPKAKDIMSLLREYKELLSSTEDKFSQGYACACATMLKGHGQDTCVEDTFEACFMDNKTMKERGVDEYDIEILTPIVKELERKYGR